MVIFFADTLLLRRFRCFRHAAILMFYMLAAVAWRHVERHGYAAAATIDERLSYSFFSLRLAAVLPPPACCYALRRY